MRKINFGFEIAGIRPGMARCFLRGRRVAGNTQARSHFFGFVLFKGTGVGFLLSDTEFREHIENCVRWNLELPGQLVNADFTHMMLQTLAAPWLTDLL